jgi:hypothetical protein
MECAGFPVRDSVGNLVPPRDGIEDMGLSEYACRNDKPMRRAAVDADLAKIVEAIVTRFVYVCNKAMRHGECSAMRSEKLPDVADKIMAAMVRLPPEPHKDAPRPNTKRAEAQRRRRENERRRHAHEAISSS